MFRFSVCVMALLMHGLFAFSQAPTTAPTLEQALKDLKSLNENLGKVRGDQELLRMQQQALQKRRQDVQNYIRQNIQNGSPDLWAKIHDETIRAITPLEQQKAELSRQVTAFKSRQDVLVDEKASKEFSEVLNSLSGVQERLETTRSLEQFTRTLLTKAPTTVRPKR